MAKQNCGTRRPISTAKAVILYAVALVLVAAMLTVSYFADVYRELITVYFSGSGTVTTEQSEALCREIEEEGMVLLKNEGSALPLKEGSAISVFGQDSVDFVYGGAGSGSVDTSRAPTLKVGLEKYGFKVNPVLWEFYSTGAGKSYRKTVPDETGRGDFAVNEVPVSLYTDEITGSFKEYGDAAVVCIGRSGGESADIPLTPLASGYRYLQLDGDELDMLSLACANFDTVVVLLNANNPLELGVLNDPAYANVKACLWVGGVGQEGIYAIGEALMGKVNPSGRLADTWAYDTLSAPSAANMGDFTLTNSTIDRGNKYLVYAENIYIGYRYYETRYEDVVLQQGNAGAYDYTAAVQYPFGYGLSYTAFEWSGYTVTENDSGFEVSLTVKNTGSVTGKDVVEVYLQSPYTDYDREHGIEKASVVLAGFAKTALLAPGASETVKITVSKDQLEAYDAAGAGTYITDAGDYYLAAGRNAHEALNSILSAKGFGPENGMDAPGNAAMVWKKALDAMEINGTSLATGAPVSNRFENADIRRYDQDFTYLSRSDWEGTRPETYKGGSWEAPAQLLKDLAWLRTAEVIGTGSETMPAFGAEAGKDAVMLADLAGKGYDEEQLTALVQRLTADQAMRLVRLGGYATIQLDAIGLPGTQDKDGPSGISGTLVGGVSAMAYPVEVVMASTWNTELMERLGRSIGEDSVNTGVAGWYAPGVNIHRSAYSGRNFEYFSEDGFLSGMMAAHEVRGTRSKGVISYMKHFALNDQETNRYGAAIFAKEQAIREVFLKGFEYTVTLGDTNAAMASMNRVGAVWSGSHKGLMTDVLRGEWGFKGAVITDQASVPAMFYQDIISGLAAGTDLWLNTNKNYWALNTYKEMDGTTADWTTNPTVMANVQRAAKNVIYAVGSSNAMTDLQKGSSKAPWEIGLLIAEILVYGGSLLLALWTTLRFVKALKERPKNTNEEGEDIVKKPIVAVLTILALILGLAGGILGTKLLGSSAAAPAAGPVIRQTYVYGEIAGNSMNDNDYVEYELTLYTDGTYKMTNTVAVNGYSMLLANTSVSAYGAYTMGASVDGATACELGEATRILYNSYSDVGGYNMSYDTDTLTFPVELPGGIQTEKADFWAQFGPARTVYLDDAAPNRMSMETGNLPPVVKEQAPAAAAEEPAAAAEAAAPAEAPAEEAAPAEEPAAEAAAELAAVLSDDGATKLTFFSDGTYLFFFESYNVEDRGTYAVDGLQLTLTNANGLTMAHEGGKLHYVSSMSDMLTGDFTFELADFAGSGAPAEPAAAEEPAPAEAAAELAAVLSNDGATKLTFFSDGTYLFFFESYNVEDRGTYAVDGLQLTLTNANGLTMAHEGGKLHYVSSMSDMLTGDFTFELADFAK